MLWFYCLMAGFGMAHNDASEATDWMKPAAWAGNFWGPEATRARSTGELPPLPTSPAMERWAAWGKAVLRDGDVVFRLGDAKALGGVFPLSRFIAAATDSRFSHTGIVAIEDGSPVVYDASSDGVQRQPFEVWMLDCVGPFGVKRPRPEVQKHVPGVLAFCRSQFEGQVPFDFEFNPDDAAFYCVELTEKAFRSQGLKLSEPVKIGDWERLDGYPLTALSTPTVTKSFLARPITMEQPVFVPGNDRQGVWSSPLLLTVYAGETAKPSDTAAAKPKNDLDLIGHALLTFRAKVNAAAMKYGPYGTTQDKP